MRFGNFDCPNLTPAPRLVIYPLAISAVRQQGSAKITSSSPKVIPLQPSRTSACGPVLTAQRTRLSTRPTEIPQFYMLPLVKPGFWSCEAPSTVDVLGNVVGGVTFWCCCCTGCVSCVALCTRLDTPRAVAATQRTIRSSLGPPVSALMELWRGSCALRIEHNRIQIPARPYLRLDL